VLSHYAFNGGSIYGNDKTITLSKKGLSIILHNGKKMLVLFVEAKEGSTINNITVNYI